MAALPEVGQLVRMRERRYVVTDARARELVPALQRSTFESEHVVDLASVEGRRVQALTELPALKTGDGNTTTGKCRNSARMGPEHHGPGYCQAECAWTERQGGTVEGQHLVHVTP
jgi:hypothetical protein